MIWGLALLCRPPASDCIPQLGSMFVHAGNRLIGAQGIFVVQAIRRDGALSTMQDCAREPRPCDRTVPFSVARPRHIAHVTVVL